MLSPRQISSAEPIHPDDLWRFAEGTHDDIAAFLGAHPDETGTTFRVWAPSARSVSVMGDFNAWENSEFHLSPSEAGIWSGHLTDVGVGEKYKYHIVGPNGHGIDKADPVAFASEEPPPTSSIVAKTSYEWGDDSWMETRGPRNAHDAPIAVYELHMGSWRFEPDGYRGIARQLADYLDETHFTHVELMPIMAYPFYGSWGYQTTGYFMPTSRFGSAEDLMYMIDLLHQRGYGVILDWVPSHFPCDEFALDKFDGTHLYEHADPRLGFHPDWKSAIFNYDRHEVRSFLISSARFWLSRFHVDGLRVDAVASMLYRDYSRKADEWVPNEHGGRENLGAIAFLQELNRRVYSNHPDVMMIAEESTAWGGVSRPTDGGGLGFGYKWDMGWMNDTLRYLERDPIHRSHHYDELTFRMVYAFTENFMLSLSHDEVVHGKGSLLSRQPGDRWQQFAGLRLLFGYQYGLPGKKLMFMGSELAMDGEWKHEEELPWDLLQYDEHRGVKDWVSALNQLYRSEPSLHQLDVSEDGFQWVVGNDNENSVIAFLRKGSDPSARPVLVVCNFTPVPRPGYRLGVPSSGMWTELLNGDDLQFGGSDLLNGEVATDDEPAHGHDQSIEVTVPPLSVSFFAPS